MKILTVLLMSLTLGVGCAQTPKHEPPDWGDVALPPGEVTDPVSLPQLCEIVVIEAADGSRHGTWSAPCWNALSQYEIIAEGNTQIAQANASALRNTEGAYGSLIKAGEMQQRLTNHFEVLLAEEKKEHFIDNMIYRVLVALGLVVAL